MMPYIVMRLNAWSSIEIVGLPLCVDAGDGMPTAGYLAVWETYEEAQADSSDGKYAIRQIERVNP